MRFLYEKGIFHMVHVQMIPAGFGGRNSSASTTQSISEASTQIHHQAPGRSPRPGGDSPPGAPGDPPRPTSRRSPGVLFLQLRVPSFFATKSIVVHFPPSPRGRKPCTFSQRRIKTKQFPPPGGSSVFLPPSGVRCTGGGSEGRDPLNAPAARHEC